jgi:hypothetical protein
MKIPLFILIISAFVLLYLIFKLIDYLVKENYIVECFINQNYSHSVDLPLTTTYSCKNFCGPTSKCAITGEQCFIDADCKGCTIESFISKPVQANFGVNTWRKSFDEGLQIFNKRYKPNQLQFMPNYKTTYGVTGEFIDDGPLPSNY